MCVSVAVNLALMSLMSVAAGNQSAMNSSYYSSGNRASMGVNGMAGMSNMSNMSGGWGM